MGILISAAKKRIAALTWGRNGFDGGMEAKIAGGGVILLKMTLIN